MKRLLRITMATTILLSVMFMTVVLVYAENRQIEIHEKSGNLSRETGVQDVSQGVLLNLSREYSDSKYMIIPLEDSVMAENVHIENHYMDKELWVRIQGIGKTFFMTHGIDGNVDCVTEGRFFLEEDAICLRFSLTDIYEYRSVLDKNTLQVEFVSPSDHEDMAVVVDLVLWQEQKIIPDSEKAQECLLDVAEALEEKLGDINFHVYYTSPGTDFYSWDSLPEAERKALFAKQREKTLELVKKTNADYYIQLGLVAAEEEAGYGMLARYNSDYFIPGFGNVELADLLERELVTQVQTKALGIESCNENSLLKELEIPAAEIALGHWTNSEEAALLQTPEYQEMLAEGLKRIMTQLEETHE